MDVVKELIIFDIPLKNKKNTIELAGFNF